MVAVHTKPEIEDQIKSLMAQALDDVEEQGQMSQGSQGASRTSSGARASERSGDRALRQYVDGKRQRGILDPIYIRDLIVPGVGNRRIFRILLTNACKYSCDYCPMRAQRDLPRHALDPARLAQIFMSAYRRGWCDGLFITSGIPRSPVWAMEKMLELVELLRVKLGYRGYLHVKAMAGAEPGQVERLVRLVDRVSYNLEAACERTLVEHAPEKSLEAGVNLLEIAKKTADEIRSAQRASAQHAPGSLGPGSPLLFDTRRATAVSRGVGGMRAGATTQFVVGLGKETDRDLLTLAEKLEKRRLIHHPQFAAFRPIRDTPLEGKAETPVLRERRLYQADHLIRDYGFRADELVYDVDGKLPLDQDPKLKWALEHPDRFPIELSTASREELRYIPGFGPRSIERFLALRIGGTVRGLEDLRKLGAVTARCAGLVTWRGRLLGTRQMQGSLFDDINTFPRMTYDVSPGTFR